MKKDSKIYLEHILDSINLIKAYTEKISKEEFMKSMQSQDAVIRRLEIIGEAVKQIPEQLRNNYRQIPWKKIAGLRAVLIHEYFGVDLKLVWETLQKDIPELEKNILNIINENK